MISAGVQNCLMCLILSSALQSKATDPNLVDKETILSFLQVIPYLSLSFSLCVGLTFYWRNSLICGQLTMLCGYVSDIRVKKFV